ncbi:DUF354 domain-containing protein [Larkinella soli]|uniref:DUF354 domain-containing protein n=1 Tax=Larkinella soli TaxID=1770527 RepID=UPI000FFB80CA|nr:DUF354 domain-containing protein [Larkinella soli]
MKILIDIGHPAHVHYFRNAIRLLQEKGHQVAITARDKEVTFNLLKAYNLPYVSRGKGGRGLVGKMLYLLKGNAAIARVARSFRPDLFLSFGSPYAAQVSKLFGKPHIAFDDTEHARFEHLMYLPFTDTVVTPNGFRKDLGAKQIRYQGYIELCHLAPTCFQPDERVLEEMGLTRQDRFVILRFISWGASHDVGQHGLSRNQKIDLVERLSRHARVFISSEGALPPELEGHRIRVAPEKLHHLLAFASLYIGEGSTTASECALLGVPNILVNSLLAPDTCPGVHLELKQYGLQELFVTFDGVTEKAVEILSGPARTDWQERRQRMLSENIDVTAFMAWLVGNYPASLKELKENPARQNRFLLTANPV